MMALSVRQPWLYCVTHLGKRLENRTWVTRYRGPILLHAAKGMTREEYLHAALFINAQHRKDPKIGVAPPMLPAFETLQRGGIVARAKLIDCIKSPGALPLGKSRAWGDEHIVPWWMGPVGFVLDDVEPIPFKPMKGSLGLFEVDEAELERAA